MCKSIAEGGHRCRCKTAKAAADKRDAAAKRQREYMRKKKAAATTVTDPESVDTEQSPEAKTTVMSAAPDPENPFTDFTSEPALTDEQRDAEAKKLDDFFARKAADPDAQWDAAPKPAADENPFKDWVTGQPIPER
ncbi:hypothetical protein [Mycobacteroides abscessus]|uniref:hypothetical protein n=2 Tax=Mycobacteroides abscessus TaxID=36809 RepID=UPI00104BC2BF|nr:hypothetical protein [Mycobacteroides abscessus]